MKLHKQIAMWSLPVAVASLSACGGGNNTTTTTASGSLTSAVMEIGQADFVTGSANRGNFSNADVNTLANPYGPVAISGTKMYVADTGNSRVLVYNALPTGTGASANRVIGQASNTANTPSTTATGFAREASASIGDGGQLVVADTQNNRVLVWNTAPTVAGTPADVVLGQPDFVSKGTASPPTAASLNGPTAAMIASGRLVVSDTLDNRVLVWNLPLTTGAAADLVLGQADFVSSTFALTPTSATLRQPTGLWTDGFSLLVADTGPTRVLYWSQFPNSNNAAAASVMGQTSFSSATASTTQALMKSPIGVSSDGFRVFVADTGNNRVLIFNQFPVGNGALADAVLGQQDYSHSAANDDSGASAGPQDGVSETAPTKRTLSGPTGVTYSSTAKTLYVTDRNNHRVIGFTE